MKLWELLENTGNIDLENQIFILNDAGKPTREVTGYQIINIDGKKGIGFKTQSTIKNFQQKNKEVEMLKTETFGLEHGEHLDFFQYSDNTYKVVWYAYGNKPTVYYSPSEVEISSSDFPIEIDGVKEMKVQIEIKFDSQLVAQLIYRGVAAVKYHFPKDLEKLNKFKELIKY